MNRADLEHFSVNRSGNRSLDCTGRCAALLRLQCRTNLRVAVTVELSVALTVSCHEAKRQGAGRYFALRARSRSFAVGIVQSACPCLHAALLRLRGSCRGLLLFLRPHGTHQESGPSGKYHEFHFHRAVPLLSFGARSGPPVCTSLFVFHLLAPAGAGSQPGEHFLREEFTPSTTSSGRIYTSTT